VLTDRIEQLERQLGSIAMTYLQGLTNQVTSLNAALTRFGNDLDRIPAMEVKFARLTRQAKLLEEISTLVQTRMKEAQIAAAVEDPSVRVIDPAILPTRPVKPNIPLSIGLGLLAGLVIGLGAAFAKEHMDTRVRTREDLQIVTGGIPVLGMIPRITPVRTNGKGKLAHITGDNAADSRVLAVRDPRSPISEAYRSLRTNITFSRPERPPKTLVFTSPAPGDGKSTSASNLVTTLAQQGIRCLLVDADMRRGSLHDMLKMSREPGLSNVLLGAAKLEAATHRIRVSEDVGFDFLPAGTFPPNPAELLGSERMRGLLVALEEKYDVVVIDAPPLNLVTDAAVLGTNVDGVIVVARAGVTERGALQYALEQLRAVRAPVLGTLLNDLDVRKDRYYGSYVGAGYYAAAE
jgi:tyrosine-protein kinase Etk/Wzc